jgi:hypothetical protein
MFRKESPNTVRKVRRKVPGELGGKRTCGQHVDDERGSYVKLDGVVYDSQDRSCKDNIVCSPSPEDGS